MLDALVPDERVAHHREIAQALTDHPEYAVGIDRVAELARHWDAAEQAEPALRWLVASARRAEEAYAFEAAAGAYERALFWWDAVADAPTVAGVDHAALLLEAADAAGTAGHIERAADLAWTGLRRVVRNRSEPGRRGRGTGAPTDVDGKPGATNSSSSARPSCCPCSIASIRRHGRASSPAGSSISSRRRVPGEIREPAARMMEALADVDDPEIEARAHMINAWCYELFGEFDLVDIEYDHAADIARRAEAHSMLALVLYNHAAFQTSIPDLAACIGSSMSSTISSSAIRCADTSCRARYLRALALCLQGDLAGAESGPRFDRRPFRRGVRRVDPRNAPAR